jgi:UDP-galactose transporter B1
MSALQGTGGLIFGAAGIYAAFMYYGYLQEDVFDFKDASGNKFTYVWLLQSIEAFANVAVGFLGMLLSGRTSDLPLNLFAMSGTTQVGAKACMSLALASGLSFPVATLAKSAKMAPVMLGGILIGGKRFPLRQYLQVAAIIGGTVMVSMKSSKAGGKGSSVLGIVFICSSLACDGFTGGVQDKLKKECKERGVKVKPYDMMGWTNLFMFLVALVVAIVLGEIVPGLKFIIANPDIMTKVLLFAACSAMGQSFIFFVIANFGPLKCATVTTTRKIFSVLLSIFTKGHALSPLGWLGIALGSAGIAGELLPEKKEPQVAATGEARAPFVAGAGEGDAKGGQSEQTQEMSKSFEKTLQSREPSNVNEP